MIPSKSDFGADQTVSALLSGNGSIVLALLAEIEEQQPSKAISQILQSALREVKDRVLAFQIEKTLRLTLQRIEGNISGISPDALQSLLADNNRLEEIAIAVSSLGQTGAILASDVIRTARWNEFPAEILPTFCQFFRKYGNVTDAPALLELSRHPDPTVLIAALEALEHIDPTNIQSLITPLLTNPNPGIRAQAIQALYRWDKPAALHNFVSLLFSKNPDEQSLALHHAWAFPFPEIEPHLLRYVTEISDPKLLMKVSQIMKAKAHVELPFKLYWVCRTLKDQHRNLVKGILIGIARSLADSGKIKQTAQEFIDTLKGRIKKEEERVLKASLSIDLEAKETEVITAARDALSQLEKEKEPDRHQPASANTPTHISPGDYEKLDFSEKILAIGKISAQEYVEFKPQIPVYIKTAKGKELGALIKLIGRFGTSEDALKIKPFLNSDNADEVCAAIEALSKLDSEYLSIYLPQLMQNKNGKIRMHATRVFGTIDREQIKSLISGLLQSPSSKQRALAIPPAMLVDFNLVREPLIKAFQNENVNTSIEKMGLVLCANPDREIFRAVFRAWKNPNNPLQDDIKKVLDQMASKLSIALEKIATPEELLAAEEEALRKEAKSAAATQAAATSPSVSKIPQPAASLKEILTSDKSEAKTTRAKATIIIWILVFVVWISLLAGILFKYLF